MSIVPHDVAALEGNEVFYTPRPKKKVCRLIHVEERNAHGLTLLHRAALNGHPGMVKRLIGAGANIDAQCIDDGSTPLHIATIEGHYSTSNLLIREKADIWKLDEDGNTALSIALSMKKEGWQKMKGLMEQIDVNSVCYAKELHARKVMAHMTEIAGSTDFPGNTSHGPIKANLESFYGGYCPWRKIAKGILAFGEQFPELISFKNALLIAETAQLASQDENKSVDLIYARWKSHLPVIINTGHEGHHVSVLLWRNRLVLCNRASGGFSVYRFNSQMMTLELLEQIIALGDEEESDFTEFFSKKLPKELSFTKNFVEKCLESTFISRQKVGNCTWANSEGIVLPFLMLCEIQQPIKDYELGPVSLSLIQSQQSKIFHAWRSFVQIRTIKKYLEKRIGRQLPYPPDFRLLEKALNAINLPENADERLEKQKSEVSSLYAMVIDQQKH